MKQKYLILNDRDNKQIKIQEYAELNKEMLSLLCEEAYDHQIIEAAMAAGKVDLISALRTNNLYPPGIYAEKIADSVIHLIQSEETDSIELLFDDIDLLTQHRSSIKAAPPIVDATAEPDADEMPEENFDNSYDDNGELKKINTSLKIADDNHLDGTDGS